MKQSRWFLLAKIIILPFTLFHVVLVILNLPGIYQDLLVLKPNNGLSGWTQAELQAAALSVGISPQMLGTVLFIAGLLCLLCFWMMAAVLFWLKGDSWIGLLSFFFLFGTGVGFANFIVDQSTLPYWAMLINELSIFLFWPSFFMLFYLFPDGRFAPSWTRFLTPIPYAAFLLAAIDSSKLFTAVLLVTMMVYLSGGLASQVFRYHWVSNAEQRQQTKAIVFIVVIFAANIIINQAAPFMFPALSGKSTVGFTFTVGYSYLFGILLSTLIPITLGFSILRYRLWDIDVIIRRTLVYALLSAVLALFYFGSVVILQQLFRGLTGQGSDLAIILSTLSIAALFAPLRQRIQQMIDQRFYRRKYNAEHALSAFAETARDEVNVELLSGALVSAVADTMQPEKLTLWLMQGDGSDSRAGVSVNREFKL